jgi:hypothetical protein
MQLTFLQNELFVLDCFALLAMTRRVKEEERSTGGTSINQGRHCEQSEAIQDKQLKPKGLAIFFFKFLSFSFTSKTCSQLSFSSTPHFFPGH